MARGRRRPFKRLRVMAEYGSSGIWAAEPVGPFQHGMVGHVRLGLPAGLAARFDAWVGRYWKLYLGGFDATSFNAEGLALALALKRHVGTATEVVFTPVAGDGGLLPECVIDV